MGRNQEVASWSSLWAPARVWSLSQSRAQEGGADTWPLSPRVVLPSPSSLMDLGWDTAKHCIASYFWWASWLSWPSSSESGKGFTSMRQLKVWLLRLGGSPDQDPPFTARGERDTWSQGAIGSRAAALLRGCRESTRTSYLLGRNLGFADIFYTPEPPPWPLLFKATPWLHSTKILHTLFLGFYLWFLGNIVQSACILVFKVQILLKTLGMALTVTSTDVFQRTRTVGVSLRATSTYNANLADSHLPSWPGCPHSTLSPTWMSAPAASTELLPSEHSRAWQGARSTGHNPASWASSDTRCCQTSQINFRVLSLTSCSWATQLQSIDYLRVHIDFLSGTEHS
jgi:hypothetical protein